MKSERTRSTVQTRRASEAAQWLLRLQDDNVSELDLSQWFEWCADPQNLREFQHMRRMWGGFAQLGVPADEMLEALGSAQEAQASLLAGDDCNAASGRLAALPRSRRPITWRPVAVAALVVITLFGAWYLYQSGTVPRTRRALALQTSNQSSILPDGSNLTLAPRTDVKIDFAGPRRNLVLSDGEAYFKVRSDKSRPFVVETEGVRITAVGTAFDIRGRRDRVVVTVEEGVVEVARTAGDGAADPDRWRVSAGHQISYDVATHAARILTVDTERALAWREGRLEYFSEPLGSVIADINRYATRPIEVGDPQLASLPFTGTVFTGSIDDWLAAVQSSFPVRVVLTQDDHVILLRRP
jgi:transmembrane sensor